MKNIKNFKKFNENYLSTGYTTLRDLLGDISERVTRDNQKGGWWTTAIGFEKGCVTDSDLISKAELRNMMDEEVHMEPGESTSAGGYGNYGPNRQIVELTVGPKKLFVVMEEGKPVILTPVLGHVKGRVLFQQETNHRSGGTYLYVPGTEGLLRWNVDLRCLANQ